MFAYLWDKILLNLFTIFRLLFVQQQTPESRSLQVFSNFKSRVMVQRVITDQKHCD